VKIAKKEPKQSHHVRAYVALGDGYWKIDDLERAKAVWAEGLREFPDHAPLKMRLSLDGDALKKYIEQSYDFTKRVDTNLRELWAER
jgi:hypothetical protein